MGFDDIIDSAPSVYGAAATSYACFLVPAAIPLAAMQGTVVSDPAQMWHAGDRHTDLAGKADDANKQLTTLVNSRASTDNWEGKDKQSFIDVHVKPYQTALTQTAKTHNNVNGTLNTMAKVYTGAGILSSTIGTIVAGCAVAVAGTWWLPGVDVATMASANAIAGTSTATFSTAVGESTPVLISAGNILTKVPVVLAMAGGGYMGTQTGATTAKTSTSTNPAMWPGVKPKMPEA